MSTQEEREERRAERRRVAAAKFSKRIAWAADKNPTPQMKLMAKLAAGGWTAHRLMTCTDYTEAQLRDWFRGEPAPAAALKELRALAKEDAPQKDWD
jgi:hypothetical protein